MASMAHEVVKGFVMDSAKSLLGMVVARIGEEITLAWGFKDDLRNLQKQLTIVEAMLSGANEFTDGNPLFEEWLKKVRAVAYEAEDVMDEYAYELLKRKLALRTRSNNRIQSRRIPFKTKLVYFFSMSSNPLVFRLRMAHKVNALQESISKIYADAKDLGIKPVKVAAGAYASPTSLNDAANRDMQLQLQRRRVDTAVMIGRDDDKAKLIHMLCHPPTDDTSLNVVSIFGMAGLGKTTIAKSVFETLEVKEFFDERIWICVSHDFDLNKLLNDMVEQLYKTASTISSTEAILNKLQDKLQGKKYLLVLDDIWITITDVWESFRCSLQDIGGSKGTTILTTSRSKEVSETLLTHTDTKGAMHKPCICPMSVLTEDDSWLLLEQTVRDELSDPHKAAIAKRLIKRSGGVPLAIKTIGGLLRSQNKIEKWIEIEESEIWDTQDGILPSVKLSFKYLSCLSLKKCFAYCAIFNEDEVIEKDKLIQLWMAQGFLHPYDKMEHIGEEYFYVLLGNSLFQDAEYDCLGNVKSCKMHDVVHAFVRAIAGPEFYIKVPRVRISPTRDNDADRVARIGDEVRHVQLYFQDGLSFEHGDTLRTLSFRLILDSTWIEKLMANTRCLRSLSLVHLFLKKLPDSIGDLKHLRYLDVSGNKIRNLPDGLTKLYNLQTLRALSNFADEEDLVYPKVPNGFSKLFNLRHLCGDRYSSMGIHDGLGMLSGLQTLPAVDLNKDWGGRISELGSLSNLKGKLSLTGLETVGIEEAKKVNLGSKKSIEKLVLQWGTVDNHVIEQQLEALQPHPNLGTLRVNGYSGRIGPQWFKEMTGFGGLPLCKLVKLHIGRCPNLTSMPDLNRLTALKKLQIAGCTQMENLGNITSLAHLQFLQIMYCTNMTSLPNGLINLSNLRKLTLGPFSKELVFFPFPVVGDNVLTGNTAACPLLEILEDLTLQAGGMEEVMILPEHIQYFRGLKRLCIWSFSNLEALPEWMGNLTSLQKLVLGNMPRLKCLPSLAAIKHLTKLENLRASSCPLLKKACAKNNGTEWLKIRHLPQLSLG